MAVAEHDALVLRTSSDGGPCRGAARGAGRSFPPRDHAEDLVLRSPSISSSRDLHTVARRVGGPIGIAQLHPLS